MKMFKITVFSLILAGSFSVYSQDEKRSSSEHAEKVTSKMTEAYDLTEDESAKVLEINNTFFSKVESIREDENLSSEEKETAIKVAHAERKASLSDILTKEEMATFNEKEKGHLDKLKDRHPNDAPSKKLTLEERVEEKTAKMIEKLELTEEQIPKVEALNLILAQKIQGVKTDDNIAADRKKEFIEGNLNDYKISMKTVLSEDQYNKFEEMVAKQEAKRIDKKDHVKQEKSED